MTWLIYVVGYIAQHAFVGPTPPQENDVRELKTDSSVLVAHIASEVERTCTSTSK